MRILRLEEDDVTEANAADVSRLMTELAGEPRAISPAELRRVAQANHLIVALDRGRVVGLVCLVPMFLPQGVRLWLESVIVDPAHRRRGLGAGLLEAALAAAATYGSVPISLTSNPTRGEAHRLFARLGFVRAETSVFRRVAAMAPE